MEVTMLRSILLLCLELFTLCPLLAAAPAHLFYSGMVGKYPIQCTLDFKDTVVKGKYNYLAFGDSLVVDGKLNATGELTLFEYEAQNMGLYKITGIFSGRISDDRRSFTGTWSSANGKRHLPVSLTAVSEYFDSGLSTYNSPSGTPVLQYESTYPIFFGTSPKLVQLNELLAKQ